LDKNNRKIVLNAILQASSFRCWDAYAIHVRSNHVHIVVSGDAKPERIMGDFKAYATKAIKKNSPNPSVNKKYWSKHGSTKYLWAQESVASAIEYVKSRQGKAMSLWVALD
jgi:REP element-mobilizing transposase RayT